MIEADIIKQCTGVIANTEDSTAWCCFMNGDPIPYGPGNFVLYYNKEHTTECLFGFDEDCNGCIRDGMWYGYYGATNPNTLVNFRITFTGDLCSTISGTQ